MLISFPHTHYDMKATHRKRISKFDELIISMTCRAHARFKVLKFRRRHDDYYADAREAAMTSEGGFSTA